MELFTVLVVVEEEEEEEEEEENGFLVETPSVTDLRVRPWKVSMVSILKPSSSLLCEKRSWSYLL